MNGRSIIDLRYWRRDEFILTENNGSQTDWWPFMSVRLLVLLDTFRFIYGVPCRISPHPRALGRRLGDGPDDSFSQHNIDRWGEIRAADVLPQGMTTVGHARKAVSIAHEIGITGVGIYPHWKPTPGVHLDVRGDEAPGDPALWGGVNDDEGNQVYVALDRALVQLPG